MQRKKIISKTVIILCCIILAAFFIFPILLLFINSFKSLKEIYISIALLDKTYETRLEVLRLLEEEIEYEISYPNQLIKEVYDYCLLY